MILVDTSALYAFLDRDDKNQLPKRSADWADSCAVWRITAVGDPLVVQCLGVELSAAGRRL